MKRVFTLTVVAALGAALAVPAALAQESAPDGDVPMETVARIRVDSTDDLRELDAAGIDLTHDVSQGPDGTFDATVVVPRDDLASLTRRGATVLDTLQAPTQAEARAQLKGNAAPLTAAQKQAAKPATGRSGNAASNRPPPTNPDTTLTVLRADRWSTPDGNFVSVEVRSDLGAEDDLVVTTDDGTALQLSAFTDLGEYLYHRMGVPVRTDEPVQAITATSSDGTSVTAQTTEWAAGDVEPFPDDFAWGFTDDGYVDPVQSDAMIEELAAQFPDIAEVIDLPYDTHGYNVPDGRVELQAPADYPRDAYTVKALRIGSQRDGSKTGVLMYSQEHAREWVTSLSALETASRLTYNYGTDPTTTSLVDNLDIFIVPIVNPDGTAFSLYDDRFMRSNMNIDDCPVDYVTNAGINLNRNFTVGSVFDGYVGANLACGGSNYAGASEASEPESKNELWLTDTFSNIQFAMNTHSWGGYFMWSPGSYLPDRTPLPRPDLATEEYFFAASETILSEIKEFRGTVVWPGRTGPVIDVLYSAAGNSGDEHFYDDALTNDPEIYAWDFEVGAPLWQPETQTWDLSAAGAFWPDFAEEGFAQGMEFANGWYGMLEVARDFALDDDAPESEANVTSGAPYDGPVDVFFDTTEPAAVYYTTDGSRPTWDSPEVEQDGVRGGAAPVEITDSGRTILQWFSVDQAGNVEGGYNPDAGRGKGLNRVVITIR